MRRALAAALLLSGLLLPGCASHPYDTPEMRDTIRFAAIAEVGKPYRYGGAGPASFDCSGLVQYVFAEAGIALPRSAREQRKHGEHLDFDEARPGDLLFYKINNWFGVDHVAIYIGDGYAVHAPASGRSVVVTDMTTPFWQKHFKSAVNVLR